MSADRRAGWTAMYRSLVDAPSDLAPADLETLAVAAYMVGEDTAALAAWEEAHRRLLAVGERGEAARCGFWAAICLMFQGRMAHAGGWLSRIEREIGDELECAAHGYLLVPVILEALDAGDASRARDIAERAAAIAARVGEVDLGALATLGHGQALIALGDHPGGIAELDDVMLSVEAGEVGPITSGIVYCAVILECFQIFDLQRAAEWTSALAHWCLAQPDLVPYRGQCLVHQSQLQQAAGDWSAAATTASSACVRLSDPAHPALGLARYQEAEMHRLVGRLDEAADMYAQASKAGYEPMPGLALLELERGQAETAAASIRRVLADPGAQLQRPSLLAAAADILPEAGDLRGARLAADELSSMAESSSSEVLRAMAARADGRVLLAERSPADALGPLRAASDVWRRLDMPYDAARTEVLIGIGCRELGDHTTAALVLSNACETFETLGARPDLERVQRMELDLRGADRSSAPCGLSRREVEVLALVARGRTNRAIADELTISHHTVGRHLENIFAKLGVNGRAAATAHAYEHGLL